ncbi:MAG TPA: dihydroneopterin aldolase [Bacillota bacterium]|nr:dihydroneopterin aldolase [Bacillota bacterium]
MDKIKLVGMEFYGYSGVLPEERVKGQNFIVSLTLSIPRIVAATTDNLSDTVDYSQVFDIAQMNVEERSFALIERMAEQIIIDVLHAFPMIESINAVIEKPDAPIEGHFQSMQVDISRSREEMAEWLHE